MRDDRQKIVTEQATDGSWSVCIYRRDGSRWRLVDSAYYDTLAEALNWTTVNCTGGK